MIIMQDILKTFGDVRAVDDVTIQIEEGSFTTLLGPSGCGKTTLLRCLSGLEEPDRGLIQIGDKVVYSSQKGINEAPKDRGVGLVFQSYALWPHMTVFENVAYGLKVRKAPKEEIEHKVNNILKSVELDNLGYRYPNELSGGQQQRVSMARMLIMEPQLLLMDEPLSNLDAKLRMNMQMELKRIHKDTGITIVYVTHDQTEAMTMSTHIAVFNQGKIEQYDPPRKVYNKSANLFVADFIGSTRINLFPGSIKKNSNGEKVIDLGANTVLPVPDHVKQNIADGGEVVIAIRPEKMSLVNKDTEHAVASKVYSVLDYGSDLYVELRIGDVRAVARTNDLSIEADQTVYLGLARQGFNLYDKESGRLLTS